MGWILWRDEGGEVASEEAIAVVQGRGDGGWNLNGGVETGNGDGTEVYSILEEESVRLANVLDVECGGRGKAEMQMTPAPDLSNGVSLTEVRKPGRNSFSRRRGNKSSARSDWLF